MRSNLLQNIWMKFGWAVLTVASIFLFGITAMYFSFCSDCNFLLKKQDVVFNPFWRTAFYIHISGGMLAVLSGPFQFLKILRQRYLRFHRFSGKIYLVSILLLAGPSGQFMAFYAEGGPFSTLGFLVMALLWLFTTWMALISIRKRAIQAHRDWMVRSFALTLAAVTLRLWVPFASYGLHIDQDFVIESSAWVSWVPNLIVAELLVRFLPKKL